ncbi:MAG: CBS domain-containing protein, partial [Candidatus Omnitrophica bacterium]|nr:CBS domain-containing protein [Candidatus Omnitrophota bacterium]
VCVVDGEGKLVGIFTERDAVIRVAAEGVNISVTPISSVMTKDPLVMHIDDNLGAILNKMSDAGFRHVPILDGEKLVGITSVRGVLNYITEKRLS